MSTDGFVPQNALEEVLAQAATDPAARPRFMELLLESDVLIVPAEDVMIVDGKAVQGTTIKLASIQHKDQNYLPFFTSEARIAEGTKYLGLKARDFFEFTKGAYLLMNPGSGYGKEFFPDEVAALIDGSYLKPQTKRVIEKETQVLIGQPASPPEELMQALSRLYKDNPTVRRAFLCLYHDASREKEPGLLILLDVDSDESMQKASAESGVVIGSIPTIFPYTDLIRFDESGIGGYFGKSGIPPFYQKA